MEGNVKMHEAYDLTHTTSSIPLDTKTIRHVQNHVDLTHSDTVNKYTDQIAILVLYLWFNRSCISSDSALTK